MLRVETRRRARALQLLYAWETRGRPTLSALVPDFARLLRVRPGPLEDIETLALRVIDELPRLDALIAAATAHWRMDRIGRLERMILRLGTAELLRPSVPARTAIDESLWLTHRFVGEGAIAFVNGVLDRVARDLGRL